MRTIDWADVELALNDVDFPASKQRLVAHAEQGGNSQAAIKALRALPLAIYESLAEVRRSIPLDTAEGDDQTAARKMKQARSEHSTHTAERLREGAEDPLRHRGGL